VPQDADGTVDAIFRAFSEHNVSRSELLKKLAGMCGDNASVNMGSDNGVGAKLRELQPRTVVIGCSSHLQALHAKDASGIVGFLETAVDTVKCLSEMYNSSPKNWRELSKIAAEIGITLLSFKRPFAVCKMLAAFLH
jgi:hypothetical protein